MVEQCVADLSQLLLLGGGQLIEEVDADALDVVRRGRLERREPLVREHRQGAAAVGGAALAPHPSGAFEPGDRVREAAAGRLGRVRELAHAQAPLGCLREHDEDLVVAERQSGIALEVALELLPEKAGREDPVEPDLALLVRRASGAAGSWFERIRF